MRVRFYVSLSHWGFVEIDSTDVHRYAGRYPIHDVWVSV